MNYTYLLINALFLGFTIYTLVKYDHYWDTYNDRGFLPIMSLFAFIIMLMMSPVLPIGDESHTTFPAVSQRVGNEVIIQSDCPTIIVTDFKYENVNVEILRTTTTNVWGCLPLHSYEVGIVEDPN